MKRKWLRVLMALSCFVLTVGVVACGSKDEGEISSSGISVSSLEQTSSSETVSGEESSLAGVESSSETVSGEESSSESAETSSEEVSSEESSSDEGKYPEDYYTDGLVFTLDNGVYLVTDYTGKEKEVVVPSVYNGKPVTSIFQAFQGCSTLTSVTIGKGVTRIAERAFASCYSLTEVVIPDSVTSIGEYAFYACSNLTEIVIPDSVTNIHYKAFLNSNNLQYTVDGNLKYLGNSNNPYLYLAGVTATDITTAIIHENCKLIPKKAFASCYSLTEVVIPDSVTSIGEYAFYDCENLKYNEDGNLKYLGNSNNPYLYLAGVKTTDITAATINKFCKLIGDSVFLECGSLTEVVIPESVKSIGALAFYNCSSLTGVYITDVAAWCNISFGDSSANPLRYGKMYVKGELISKLIIPDGVTGIGDDAFAYCKSLTEVVIPNSVTSIGNEAFYGCSNLTSVTIGNGVTNIGDKAFSSCSSLTAITFEGTVKEWTAMNVNTDWNNCPATEIICKDETVTL